MVASAWGGASDADVVVHLIDAPRTSPRKARKAQPADRKSAEDTETIIENLKATRLQGHPGPEQDRRHAPRHPAGPVASAMFETGVYSEVYMISALSGDGVDDLKQRLARSMPSRARGSTRRIRAPTCRCAFWPPRSRARRSICASTRNCPIRRRWRPRLVRGQGRWFGPYRTDHLCRAREPTPIILGKGGQTLKWIGQKSREELTELLDRPVHLFLTVKVDPEMAGPAPSTPSSGWISTSRPQSGS
jgi:GTP-binding protein Era